MAAVRRAEATWKGDLATGKGVVSGKSSGTFSGLDVSWARRSEADANGVTSPEELLAAAHAACYAMAFSAGLGRRGTPPEHLHVEAEVTFDKVGDGWGVTSSRLTVLGHVDGISHEEFEAAAQDAKDGCPISSALKGNLEITVDATLES